MFDALLFDFDMTLIDSSPAMLRSFDKLCARFNRPPVTRQKLMDVIGLHDEAFWRATVGELTQEMADFYIAECAPEEPDWFVPFEGCVDVLEKLRRRGVKTAVATNRNAVGTVLDRTGLAPYFDAVATSGMVPNPKPAPDVLLLALEKLGLPPERALYVGDTVIDLQAGAAAGVSTAVLCTSTPREELERHHPRWMCADWRELGRVLDETLQ